MAETGDVIPADGDVVKGIATVDESSITGESAPVIRESGGDRSAVTGGTRVVSDRIVVEIRVNPGESFLDRMIGLVEGAKRQKTPNEIALNILLIGLTLVFLIVCVHLARLCRLFSSRRRMEEPRSALPCWWRCWSALLPPPSAACSRRSASRV